MVAGSALGLGLGLGQAGPRNMPCKAFLECPKSPSSGRAARTGRLSKGSPRPRVLVSPRRLPLPLPAKCGVWGGPEVCPRPNPEL